jgi:hypothetical protein
MELIILIGIVAAAAAGAACYIEHGIAERHAWDALERYGWGALTWLVAVAAPLFAAPLPIEWAVLLYGMAWLIIGGMAVGTWAAYQKPAAMPDEEDALAEKIDEALRQR